MRCARHFCTCPPQCPDADREDDTPTTPTKNHAQRSGRDGRGPLSIPFFYGKLYPSHRVLHSTRQISVSEVRKISKGFIAIFVMRQPELETLEPKSRRGPSQPHTRTYQMLASRMRSDPEHLTLQHTLHPRVAAAWRKVLDCTTTWDVAGDPPNRWQRRRTRPGTFSYRKLEWNRPFEWNRPCKV